MFEFDLSLLMLTFILLLGAMVLVASSVVVLVVRIGDEKTKDQEVRYDAH